MDKIKKAIETLYLNKGIVELDMSNGIKHKDSDDFIEMCDIAIEALEKQAFFENQVLNISGWFVDNKDCLLDAALTVSTKSFNQYNENGKIDEVDLEFIVSDIVDEIQEGILNVLDSYKVDN